MRSTIFTICLYIFIYYFSQQLCLSPFLCFSAVCLYPSLFFSIYLGASLNLLNLCVIMNTTPNYWDFHRIFLWSGTFIIFSVGARLLCWRYLFFCACVFFPFYASISCWCWAVCDIQNRVFGYYQNVMTSVKLCWALLSFVF